MIEQRAHLLYCGTPITRTYTAITVQLYSKEKWEFRKRVFMHCVHLTVLVPCAIVCQF